MIMAAILHFLLIHIVWALPIVLVAVCVLVPGAPAALLAFARSIAGRILIVCLISFVIGWELHGAIDASWDRSVRLRSDLEAANARAAIEAARAVENARLAMAQHDIAAAAASRESAANEAIDSLQEQVDTYASELARVPAPSGCRLSADDTRRLRGIASETPRR